MDTVLLLGLLVVAVLAGPWFFLWMLHRRLLEQAQRIDRRFGDVVERLHHLEGALQKFERGSTPDATVMRPVEPVVSSQPKPAIVVESHPVEPAQESRVAEEIPKPAAPLQTPTLQNLPAEPRPLFPSTPPAAQVTSTLSDRIQKGGGLEEVLGKNWLNKAGIVLLVLGIAFFLEHQLVTMGPAGKILIGYTVSLALLGAGVWFERSDNYRILARAGIGGGWALLFFTTYAMYHVPAAQVLSSELLDLVLMLIVALVMVAHTLRYNSQTVTALAFLLAFLTIFVSRVNVYSLTAGIVLALGIVLISVKRRWFELEVFGIVATYLNHYFWLRTILEPMGDHRQPFAEFVPSVFILFCYWLIYRISYVIRRVENSQQENVSTGAALLNTALLVTLLKYQSLHPEWAFWTLLLLGLAELAVAQLPVTKRRRTAFAVLATIGATLVIAAVPFRYSGENISILWMMEAETFFLAGIWSGEIVFTRLGMLGGIATAGQMLFDDSFHILADRLSGVRFESEYRVGLLVLGLGALVLYANAHWFGQKWKQLFDRDLDAHLLAITSYAAAALATSALWMTFPRDWTAVAWSALAFTLSVIAHRFDWEDVAIQANLISGASLLRVIIFNLSSETRYHGISLRLITVAIVAALYYLTSHWTSHTFRETSLPLSSAYTWTASVLVGALIWYEADPIYMALLWAVFGAVLFQVGLRNRESAFRWQAYGAIVASFLRVLMFNLTNGPHPGDLRPSVYSTLPLVIAAFYVYARTGAAESSFERIATVLHGWLGTVVIADLVRYETQPDWLVTAWACLILLLLAAAWWLKQRVLTRQAVVFSGIVLLRAIFVNFDNFVPGWGDPSLAVAAAALILLISLYFCFQVRKVESPKGHRPLELTSGMIFDRPEQTLFFVPLIMITFLLGLEMRHGLITVSWGIEGVLVFLFALLVGERSFRLSGLALLLLCVGKVVVIDVWGLNSRDRYITFIIMGCALLLVSFLYTRHKDAIKQYL